jgi:hypothetical protein
MFNRAPAMRTCQRGCGGRSGSLLVSCGEGDRGVGLSESCSRVSEDEGEGNVDVNVNWTARMVSRYYDGTAQNPLLVEYLMHIK